MLPRGSHGSSRLASIEEANARKVFSVGTERTGRMGLSGKIPNFSASHAKACSEGMPFAFAKETCKASGLTSVSRAGFSPFPLRAAFMLSKVRVTLTAVLDAVVAMLFV